MKTHLWGGVRQYLKVHLLPVDMNFVVVVNQKKYCPHVTISSVTFSGNLNVY